MKSVFLLCEYGISYNTISQLYERNITLEDIINNNDIIDNILGTGEKKNQILLNLDKAYSRSDNFSVYDLIEFGLSKNIVEFLFENKIRISDIDETIKEKYEISENTYNKIINAIQLMVKSKNISLNLTNSSLFSLIKSNFNNSNFTIYELIDLIESKHYKFDDETLLLLEELIRQNKIKKNENLYFIPYKVEDLKKYGLSNLLVKFLNENDVKLSNILEKNFALPFEVLPSKYNKVLEAFNKFRQDTNYILELTNENMITLIKKYFENEPFKIEQFIDKIEECGFLKNNLDDLISYAIENNILKKKNDIFSVVYPTLKQELEKINNKNFHKDMVIKKLSGMTLEQIGDEYGVTRERIRQIVTKELNKISTVSEEEYKHYFIKYNIDVETFS